MYIFLDLDDTLIDSNGAHKKAIRFIYEEHLRNENLKIDIEQIWLNIMEEFLNLYFQGEISLEQQRISKIQKFWNYFGKSVDRISAQKIYHKYHSKFLNSCSVFSDVIPTLNRISNYKIGILSNGTYPDQIFKIENNNLNYYFDRIFISEQIGYSKPDKRIFEHVAKQVNESIGECIYVGNSYKLDYLGSLNAGMKAIWLDRSSSDNKSNMHIINSFKQLPNHSFLLKR